MSRALVLGRSLPALAAALELAEVGIELRIGSASACSPRGAVRDPGGEIARLLEEVAAPFANGAGANPEAAPVRAQPDPVRLIDRRGGFRLPPEPAVWGIPAVALSAESLAFLGTPAALRLYLDRLKPVLTIGKQENLAKLVETRIGASARELLVEPLVFERFGLPANEVEASIVAPGLEEAITRAGSLTGAAALLLDAHIEREALVAPAGGWDDFGERLLARLSLYGAEPVELDDGEDSWDLAAFDAVIVDAGSETAVPHGPGGLLDADARELRPARTRVYAEIGIEPLWERDDPAQPASLMLESGPRGETWATRVLPVSEGRWIAQLQGPALPFDEAGTMSAESAVAELCEWFGFEQRGESGAWVVAAPYASRAERDEQEAVLDAWHEAHPGVIACGEQLHGGALGGSLADARRRAIELRRRILGIAE